MSRIGNLSISIPSAVTVEKTGRKVLVTGPKGSLSLEIDPKISVEVEPEKIIVNRKNDQKRVKSLHGLTRSLMANMIDGVTEGWSKDLELVGVGFRVQGGGNKLTLNIGYSHPVDVLAPEGINFEVLENTGGASGTKIKVSGIDKQLVGQVAANIRKIKIPDVYKGKGIRMVGEYVRKKLGKSGKVGVAGAVGGAK